MHYFYHNNKKKNNVNVFPDYGLISIHTLLYYFDTYNKIIDNEIKTIKGYFTDPTFGKQDDIIPMADSLKLVDHKENI